MTSPDPDAVTAGHTLRSRGANEEAQARGEAGEGTRGHGGERHAGGGSHRGGGGHSALFLAVAGTLAVVLFVTFVALGTWQLKRRVWKLDLIARVEQRVHAPPTAAPGQAEWSKVSAAKDEYRHVAATGTFLDESQTLVQAVTELGAGYWVLTPLRAADGTIVLVNRGFIPAEDRDRVARAAVDPRGATNTTSGGAIGTAPGAANAVPGRTVSTSPDGASAGAPTSAATSVAGLLRMTEPRGAFLRHNDAAANHWYSRDVQAIAAARGLPHVAPYFIDAEAAPASDVAPGFASTPSATTAPSVTTAASATTAPSATSTPGTASAPIGAVVPVGGLTVITFHNSHLVYAITWYTLALMVAGAIWLGIRSETRA